VDSSHVPSFVKNMTHEFERRQTDCGSTIIKDLT
jgi:hypothetical protein